MTDVLANFTGVAGTNISDYTSDSGHSFQSGSNIVLDGTGGAYLTATGAISSKILTYTTPAIYDVTLTLAKKSNSGNIAVFIGDYPASPLNGYLFIVDPDSVNATNVRARVLKFVNGSLTVPIAHTGDASSLVWRLSMTDTGIELFKGATSVATSADLTFPRLGQDVYLRPSVASAVSTGYHFDALEIAEVIPPPPETPPYPKGVYPMTVTNADAPAETDNGTLTVYASGAYLGVAEDYSEAPGMTPQKRTHLSIAEDYSEALPVVPAAGFDAGAYSLTGAEVAFVVARGVPAGAGAYSMTGVPVALTAHYLLTAAPASYTLTGAEAALRRGFTLQAVAAAYDLTGAPVVLSAHYTSTAEPGGYTLTGAPAGVSGDATLTGAPGSYTLTGAPVGFSVYHAINATAGSYTLSGAAAVLRASSDTVQIVGRIEASFKAAGITAHFKEG